jgi:hypothetical protein
LYADVDLVGMDIIDFIILDNKLWCLQKFVRPIYLPRIDHIVYIILYLLPNNVHPWNYTYKTSARTDRLTASHKIFILHFFIIFKYLKSHTWWKFNFIVCDYNSYVDFDRSLLSNYSILNVLLLLQQVNYDYRDLCVEKSHIFSIAFENRIFLSVVVL